jgi:DNA polymerase-1
MALRPDNSSDVMIIDGLNLVFRIFHGLGNVDLSTGGQDTGVLYGCINTLQKLIRDFYPRAVVICWDGKGGKNRRKDLYPPYKEGRASLDKESLDSIFEQVTLLQEYVRYSGMCNITLPTWEADDVMVALADWVVEEGKSCCIITSDNDLQQVISDKVAWFDPILNRYLDVPRFREKYDFMPAQLIDYKMLVGDKSDNIAGIAGIGSKTATTIIKEYGSVDSFLLAKEFSGRLKIFEEPETHELLKVLRKIIDIRAMQSIDLPMEVGEAWIRAQYTRDEMAIFNLFHKFRFKSLLADEEYIKHLQTLHTLENTEVLHDVW